MRSSPQDHRPTPPRLLIAAIAVCIGCAALFAPPAAAKPRMPDGYDAYNPPPPAPPDDGADLWRMQAPFLNTSAPIFQEFADYPLLSATLRRSGSDTPDAYTLRLGLGQRLWKPIGPNTPDQAWTSTSLSAEAGFYHSNLAWVQARSYFDMAWLASGEPVDPSQSGTIAQGSHRVRGQVGVGEVGRGLGADLEVDARLDHAAPLTLRARPFDVLPIGHRDAAVMGRVWLRAGRDDTDGGFVMPVSYEVRDLTYTDATLAAAAPLRGVTRHTMSAGIGIRPYMINGDGWFEFIGLSWHRAQLDLNNLSAPAPAKACCAAAPAAADALTASAGLPRFSQLEQIDLRALHADKVTLYEDDVTISGYFFVGGSWMWDPVGAQQASMLSGAYGMSARFENGSAGFVFSRRPGLSPDGSRPVAAHRLEWLAEVHAPDEHIGGSFRASSAWLQDLHRDVDAQTMQSQHTLHTELFFSAWPGASLGVFHSAGSFGAGDSGWAAPTFPTPYGAWQHQLGAFLRVSAEPLSLF